MGPQLARARDGPNMARIALRRLAFACAWGRNGDSVTECSPAKQPPPVSPSRSSCSRPSRAGPVAVARHRWMAGSCLRRRLRAGRASIAATADATLRVRRAKSACSTRRVATRRRATAGHRRPNASSPRRIAAAGRPCGGAVGPAPRGCTKVHSARKTAAPAVTLLLARSVLTFGSCRVDTRRVISCGCRGS